jgi:gamma-glutamylcyclotransferase (GGCT)/AIG2-like uncharacterized protein YtfP
VRYFGYGSNLDTRDLRRWCGEKGMPLGRYEPAGAAFLPDHALAFHYYSRPRSGGALDVTPATGCAVPGMLFDIDDSARAVLDRKEGLGLRYELREVTVLRSDGSMERAFTYGVMAPYREGRFIAPTDHYVSVVRRGLTAHGLPSHPLAAAAGGHAPQPLPEALFVYGTLKRGHCREGLLGETRHEPATIRGELIDLGAYPGLRAGSTMVHGELHRPRSGQLPSLLDRLDPVEDFEGWHAVDRSMYHRAIVQAETTSGPQLAWTYRYRGTEERPTIADGRWRGE